MSGNILPIAMAIAGVLALGGCGLPAPVVVASYAADGVSAAATGRTVTDHALSYATGQDCAMLRLIDGVAACHSVIDQWHPMRLPSDAAPIELDPLRYGDVERVAWSPWASPSARRRTQIPDHTPAFTPPLPPRKPADFALVAGLR
ncbi:hypothetical protein [Inquilinus sp. CAU 1745]|uniref:hypothetical protein n=1 Tax=Inquilinus sp. CAU 1745 TaxID=3140369 RepID=UPI00325C03AE